MSFIDVLSVVSDVFFCHVVFDSSRGNDCRRHKSGPDYGAVRGRMRSRRGYISCQA